MKLLILVIVLKVCGAGSYDTPITTFHEVDISKLPARKTVGEITVKNGGPWGKWTDPLFCPDETFAVGYKMKIEYHYEHNADKDDTALNNIALICARPWQRHNRVTYVITPPVNGWGSWQSELVCTNFELSVFLSTFTLQVEPEQGSDDDDTAANWVKFSCRRAFDNYSPKLKPKKGEADKGYWGDFGSWSSQCPTNSTICGLSIKFESSQGSGDDTSLNDVKLYCCPNCCNMVTPWYIEGRAHGHG